MDTSALSSVYQASRPFATVLTDVSHDSENGEHEHELRVRAACESLSEQGADQALVDLVSAQLGELVSRPAPVARLVVANADGVLYDEIAGMRVDQPVASYGALPDLSAWVEHRDSTVSFVLAVVDHVGGDVGVYDSDVPDAQEETSVEGDTQFAHKVPVGGWSQMRYQHVVENTWAKNAEAVCDEVVSHVRAGHRLVLLAGDPQSRAIAKGLLEDSRATVVELESGTRADDGGDEAMQQAIREALMDYVVGRRVALIHELKERLGRGEAVATGVKDVADAFVRGQVDTLLLDRAGAADLKLDASEHPGLVLGATVPEEPLPADQALIAAAVLTDASVSACPTAAMGGAPVAALLRWHQEAVGTTA